MKNLLTLITLIFAISILAAPLPKDFPTGIKTKNIQLKNATELTIAAGVITPTQIYHSIDTEADAATDDLDTITATNFSAGSIIYFKQANTSRTITFKNSSGNIITGSDDYILQADIIVSLIYDGTNWRLAGGGGSSSDVLEYASIADFPASGKLNKLYIAKDTRYIYHWNSSSYIAITLPGIIDNAVNIATNMMSIISDGINISNNASALTSHTTDTANPHTVTATQVGLSNVDNTADADKPISTATQSAIDAKEPTLGNPATDGYILSSTIAGTRSWVAPASGTSSPLTTKGDLYTFSTADTRLPLGTNGYLLSVDTSTATGLAWLAPPTGTGDMMASTYDPAAIAEQLVGLTATQTLTNKTLTAPVINTPAGITKTDVGLANVDNTTDADKPVSTAAQTALDAKEPTLGNPATDGYILSSTIAGTRSWIAPATGSSTDEKVAVATGQTAGYLQNVLTAGTDISIVQDVGAGDTLVVSYTGTSSGGGLTTNIETLSADKTLTSSSDNIQVLNGGASDKDITLPAVFADGYFIITNSGSTNTLAIINPAQSGFIVSGAAAAYNGSYIENGTYNSKTLYTKEGDTEVIGWWLGDMGDESDAKWAIGSSTSDLDLYSMPGYVDGTGTDPATTGWTGYMEMENPTVAILSLITLDANESVGVASDASSWAISNKPPTVESPPLIAEDNGYGLANSSVGRGTVGAGSVSLEYSVSGTTYGATGDYSLAMGNNTTAAGDYSFSVGNYNNVTGLNSHAGGGQYNVVSGADASIVGGYSNNATNRGCFVAAGRDNDATGDRSSVIGGYQCTSSGANAISGVWLSVASGAQSIALGYSCTVSALSGTVSGGLGNIISSTASYGIVPGGNRASINKYGQFAHSNGKFSTVGDNQYNRLQLRKATTDATETELYLDGSSLRATIPSNAAWSVTIKILGKVSGSNNAVYHKWEGLITNNAGTVAMQGTATQTVVHEFDAACDTAVTADDTNDALKITVTGIAATSIRWHATIEFNQVIY